MNYNVKSACDVFKLVDNGVLFAHHTSLFRGYVSRKLASKDLPFYPYNGRFGKGFVVETSNTKSSYYSYKTYFIFK